MNAGSTVEALHTAIAAGDAGAALRIENSLYTQLVKHTETEEHYREKFSLWSGAMQALGESRQMTPAAGGGVAFFLHSSALLAHVDLLRQVLTARGKTKTIVACFGAEAERLRGLLEVPVYILGAEDDFAQRFVKLNEIMTREKCGTLVWVSAPLYASYALATRIAERQVYWALRFHPIVSPHIDRYVTQGSRREKSRTYHGQAWRTAHAPFTVARQEVDQNVAERYRMQLGHSVIVGTVAREEKIAHPDYLETVAEILRSIPDSLFVWTGKTERRDIRDFFLECGLAQQQRFVGWVVPDKFVCLLDVFLETFPQGGLMSWLAMDHDIPVVGMNMPSANFGWLDDIPRWAGVAVNRDEYVALATTFALDRVKRDEAVEAGRLIVERERDMSQSDARNTWEALCQ